MAQQQDIERREKLQALSLAKECYTTKLELLTNSTILADAMKFVTRHQNQQQKQKLVTEKVAQEQEESQLRRPRQGRNNSFQYYNYDINIIIVRSGRARRRAMQWIA